jgi:3-phenylpropionate/cinnamic acid dioxygenase small subunit
LLVIDAQTLVSIDALQQRYARALDTRDMAGWAGCFGENGSYICIPRENIEQGLPVALMMDDSLARIHDRVTYIAKVWAGTFEDYQTRHFMQRIDCAPRGDGLVTVESNFMVAYTTTRGRSEILVAGTYEDAIELGQADARFRSKKAVLDTATTPRYLVYPV